MLVYKDYSVILVEDIGETMKMSMVITTGELKGILKQGYHSGDDAIIVPYSGGSFGVFYSKNGEIILDGEAYMFRGDEDKKRIISENKRKNAKANKIDFYWEINKIGNADTEVYEALKDLTLFELLPDKYEKGIHILKIEIDRNYYFMIKRIENELFISPQSGMCEEEAVGFGYNHNLHNEMVMPLIDGLIAMGFEKELLSCNIDQLDMPSPGL